MGFRFQRRISFGRGLRLNFSRSGVSASVGSPGARMTFGSRGMRSTLGIPGSGISYTTQHRGSFGQVVVLALLLLVAFMMFA
jgi:hypothetical protein